jgi:hypothetical protein
LGKPSDLKERPEVTPAGTRRFEVSCGDATAALARARRIASLRDATMFGDLLHVLVDESVGERELLASLAPGDASAAARPINPTLEDVFVILSRAALAKEAA